MRLPCQESALKEMIEMELAELVIDQTEDVQHRIIQGHLVRLLGKNSFATAC